MTQLTSLDMDFALEVILRPLSLRAADLRALGQMDQRLREHMTQAFLHYPDKQNLEQCANWLKAWHRGGRGIVGELNLHTGTNLVPWQLSFLSEETFGSASQHDPQAESPELDLSISVAKGECSCFVFPQHSSLMNLKASASARQFASTCIKGTVIGATSAQESISLADKIRDQHIYVCGGTGTGKSSLLKTMILRDIRNGFVVGLLEPHGELAQGVVAALSSSERRRLTFADLANPDHGFRLNLLENEGLPTAAHSNFVCNQLIAIFKRILYRDVPESFGPMFTSFYTFSLALLMRSEGSRANLGDLDRVFSDRKWRQNLLENCPDEHIVRFWKGIAERVTHSEISLENIAPYIVSKQLQITGNPVLRPILCAPNSSINFFDTMQNGGIFIANLAKGILGEPDSALVGSILMTKIFAAALRRATVPASQRRPFRLYLDEFQTYSTDLVGDMLAEGRKFGLELTLANQSISQIDGRNQKDDIAHAILANTGSVIAFRLGPVDANLMSRWMGHATTSLDLSQLPNYEAIGRIAGPDGAPVTRKFRTSERDETAMEEAHKT